MLLLRRTILSVRMAFIVVTSCNAASLPFTIEAVQNVSVRFPGAPKLQSFAWAQWDGKWIFIGGRTTGYHGVGTTEANFPRAGSNEKIWVIDPSSSQTYSFPVASLPTALSAVKDQWVSSNLLFFQDKNTLYLAGGYGANADGELITYPILSSVELPALIKSVMNQQGAFANTIRWT